MNRKILKNILLYLVLILVIAVSIIEIFVIFKGSQYHGLYYFNTIYFTFQVFLFPLVNLFFCVFGIGLFILYLIYIKDKSFSKKYFLLVPAVIVSILLIISFFYEIISGKFDNIYVIYYLISAIGLPLFLLYYISKEYNFILKITVCLLFPINIFLEFNLFDLVLKLFNFL